MPYLEALDAYDAIAGSQNRELMGGMDAQRRFDHLRVMVDLLADWVTASTSSFGDRHQNKALEQASVAIKQIETSCI